MVFSLGQLADQFGATTLGNRALRIRSLMSASDVADGSLVPIFSPRYLEALKPGEYAVLSQVALANRSLDYGAAGAIVHEAPHRLLSKLIDLFFPPEALSSPLVHSSAIISPSASLHPTVIVGPLAVIEDDVVIGEGSFIGPGAIICRGTRVGCFTRIGPRAVIGWEGFGFIPTGELPMRIGQVGFVEIGDHVDIGAAACIDRGTLGRTIIASGAKLDNLVQVGHNVHIESNVIIAAQTGIAGSTRIGRGTLIGGQVGVADHLTVGENARIAAKSGVTRDVPAGEEIAGYPAMKRSDWLRMIARARKRAGDER